MVLILVLCIYQDKLWDRLQEISESQYDLEPLDMSEKKFNAQSRLFVGSLPREITLEELKDMFSKHGELGQVYFNKDGAYAFINFVSTVVTCCISTWRTFNTNLA